MTCKIEIWKYDIEYKSNTAGIWWGMLITHMLAVKVDLAITPWQYAGYNYCGKI